MTTLDVLTVGEALVSLRPEGPTATSNTVRLSIAGAETNVAIALARLGHSTAWVGVTGEDRLGALILRTLRAEGVDVGSARTCEAPTGLILFEQSLPGVTTVDYFRKGSAGSTLTVEDVRAALARRPRVVHVTGVTAALSGSARRASREALMTARANGALTSFDINYRARLWSTEAAATALAPLLDHIDVLFASEHELPLIASAGGTDEPDQIRFLLERGVGRVVVKHGARGATEYTPAGRTVGGGRPVNDVDPVGAGDAFAAGYLSALLDGDDTDALTRGCTLGTFAVSTKGDWEGLPTRAGLALAREQSGATLR